MTSKHTSGHNMTWKNIKINFRESDEIKGRQQKSTKPNRNQRRSKEIKGNGYQIKTQPRKQQKMKGNEEKMKGQ